MTETEILRQIVQKQDEYNKLLSDELDEVVTIAHIHGWRSSRVEQGEQLRKQIASFLQQLMPQTKSVIKSKKEIIQSVEYIFENTKRIHGNSEALDWQKIAIHKSVSYILSELAELRQQLAECKEDEVPQQLSAYPGGWICPRCQKVHSWLSMTCDCPPNVITANTMESKELTEIKGENNCNNCKWGICLTKDWPCADCNGSNKWEPIK